MNKKKLIVTLVALIAAVAVLLGVYFATRPTATAGSTSGQTPRGRSSVKSIFWVIRESSIYSAYKSTLLTFIF